MENLAICGLVCNECEIYQATISNDFSKKKEVLQKLNNEEYPLTLNDIKCYGCQSINKPLFKFCHECDMRRSAFSTKVDNRRRYPQESKHKTFEYEPGNESDKLKVMEQIYKEIFFK
jgi:hypothetical protein